MGDYDKYSVTQDTSEYYLYQGIKGQGDEQTMGDGDTLRKWISERFGEKDWDGLLRGHAVLVTKSRGHPGLDYYYTLIMKLLDSHPTALPEKVLEAVYQTLAVEEIGPVSAKALKAVLKNPKLYAKSLSLLDEEHYSAFTEVNLPEKEVRDYILNLLTRQQTFDPKSTQLLVKLLKSQKNPQEWLEEIIQLSQKCGNHEECGQVLASCNWKEKEYAKRFLKNLAKENEQVFKKII